jgi:hypothetical protein
MHRRKTPQAFFTSAREKVKGFGARCRQRREEGANEESTAWDATVPPAISRLGRYYLVDLSQAQGPEAVNVFIVGTKLVEINHLFTPGQYLQDVEVKAHSRRTALLSLSVGRRLRHSRDAQAHRGGDRGLRQVAVRRSFSGPSARLGRWGRQPTASTRSSRRQTGRTATPRHAIRAPGQCHG